MPLKLLFILFLVGLINSCQTYTPVQNEAKIELKDQKGLLSQLENQADDLEDSYEDVKDELTDIMQREGFLIRRLVRERKRYIKFSDQKQKLEKNIADQEARGVEESSIQINKDIGEYIQEVVDETKVYIDELEIELKDVTQQGIAKRVEFDEFSGTRQKLQIKISEIQSRISELQLIIQ